MNSNKYQYKLAIVIPSWNCGKYIGEMLDSIIANSIIDWKCFVVDDQSTDDSCDIIKTYQDKDERIALKVRDREPKGAQTCRNIGFGLSEGAEYVIWFDADDVIAPYCFEQRVAFMDKHPELDFGVFPAKTFKSDVWEIEHNTALYGFPFFDDSLKAMLDRTLPMVGWTNIYRRSSVCSKNLTWDTNIMSLQDSDWNIQAILKNCRFDYAVKEGAKIDYFYRSGNNGVSKKIYSSQHSQSHIYYLFKTIRSLSIYQRVKYQDEIMSYVLWIEKKINDRKAFLRFLLQSWFLLHPWFWIRIIIFHHYGGRYEDKLFPILFRLERRNYCYLLENQNRKITELNESHI